jgi:hypothetical protein
VALAANRPAVATPVVFSKSRRLMGFWGVSDMVIRGRFVKLSGAFLMPTEAASEFIFY